MKDLICAYYEIKNLTVDVYGPLTGKVSAEDFVASGTNYLGEIEPEAAPKLLSDYDVLVLPTRNPTEGYLGVIHEAFSVGMPVIASRMGAIAEIVDQSNGILIEPGKIVQLIAAMKLFHYHPAELDSLRLGTREAAEIFSSAKWIEEFVSHCIGLCKGGQGMLFETLSIIKLMKLFTKVKNRSLPPVGPFNSKQLPTGVQRQILLLRSVIFVMLLVVFADPSFSNTLNVRGFSQPPNYVRTTDSSDMRQLTDGNLMSFPIWKKKGSVGWASASPITIEMDVSGFRKESNANAASLRLHTAKGSKAGVEIPQRIDVFFEGSDGNLLLAGREDFESENFPDRNNYWVTVPISFSGEKLVLIVYAMGRYIFFDEIVLQEGGPIDFKPPPPAPPTGVVIIEENMAHKKMAAVSPQENKRVKRETSRFEGKSFKNIAAAINFGKQELQQNLYDRALKKVAKMSSNSFLKPLSVWVEDPWETLGVSTPSTQKQAFDVVGLNDEHEVVCLGIKLKNSQPKSSLLVDIIGLPTESYNAFQVTDVLAANGQIVFDPLVPLDSRRTIKMHPTLPSFLWLDFDFSKLTPGLHQVIVKIRSVSGIEAIEISGNLSVLLSEETRPVIPRAVNWAYLMDKPIWNNPTKSFHDLKEHGINVHIVHPSQIPGHRLNGVWDKGKAKALAKFIQLSGGKGPFLFYLGWKTDNNPLFPQPDTVNQSDTRPSELRKWLRTLTRFLEGQNLAYSDWSLYPVDEPKGKEDFLRLKKIASKIKHIDPRIQLFATPTYDANGKTSLDDLLLLQDYIDIWQPNMALLRKVRHSFFQEMDKPWWLYANPRSPAKDSSPLKDYRLLSWWAWMLGSQGVGFWSYSDTAGSSAWNDFDGRRPDWAVVYEHKDMVISSRRWEAFRAGIEDFKLLSMIDKKVLEGIIGAPYRGKVSEMPFDAWTSQSVQLVRQKLLQALISY